MPAVKAPTKAQAQALRDTYTVDPTSPTGLRFRSRLRGTAAQPGDPAMLAVTKGGYHNGRCGGRVYTAHRVVWFLTHNEWPAGEIDHINGNSRDNRLENLRAVTASENGQNKLARGYRYDNRRGRFLAQIQLQGRNKFLGYFDTEESARAAYLVAKRELHPTAPGRCYQEGAQ